MFLPPAPARTRVIRLESLPMAISVRLLLMVLLLSPAALADELRSIANDTVTGLAEVSLVLNQGPDRGGWVCGGVLRPEVTVRGDNPPQSVLSNSSFYKNCLDFDPFPQECRPFCYPLVRMTPQSPSWGDVSATPLWFTREHFCGLKMEVSATYRSHLKLVEVEIHTAVTVPIGPAARPYSSIQERIASATLRLRPGDSFAITGLFDEDDILHYQRAAAVSPLPNLAAIFPYRHRARSLVLLARLCDSVPP